MDFSEALRRTMFEFHLSGADLARESGLAPNQISEFKEGKRRLRSDVLQKLCNALPPAARQHFATLSFSLDIGASYHFSENGGSYLDESG